MKKDQNTCPSNCELDDNGYYRFCNSGKLYHKWLKEKEIGRRLEPGEVVHHKNGNKQDNSIENLELLTETEHLKRHLEAKKEVEIRHKLTSQFQNQAVFAILIGFTVFGAVVFLLGKIIQVKLDMAYIGLLFLIVGLVALFIQWIITNKNS